MESSEVLRVVAQVAGIGGIALGVLFLIFRDVIRRNIFPQLKKEDAYKIIRLIIILTFTIALFGIIAWVYVSTKDKPLSSLNNAPDSSRKEPIEYKGNDGIKINFKSAQTGEIHSVFLSPKASIKYLTETGKQLFNLNDNAETGAYFPFKIRWVLIDEMAKNEWEKLPRSEQKDIRAIVQSNKSSNILTKDSITVEEAGVYENINFLLYPIENIDENSAPVTITVESNKKSKDKKTSNEKTLSYEELLKSMRKK